MQGKANARIPAADFHKFLVGTKDEPGLLSQLDLPFYTSASRKPKFFSEETLRLHTHRLGFGHEETGYGCFSDEHESEENKSDRVTRFLPEHDKYFKSSICAFSYQGQILPIDSRLVDVDGNDLFFLGGHFSPESITQDIIDRMEAASGRGQRGRVDLAAGPSATRTLKEIVTGIIHYLGTNPEWSFVLELPKGELMQARLIRVEGLRVAELPRPI